MKIEYVEIAFTIVVVIAIVVGLFLFANSKVPAYPQNSSNESVLAPPSPPPIPEEQPEEQPTVQSPPPQIEITNRTIGQLLDDGLDRADLRFYNESVSGEYEIDTFKWTLTAMIQSPDNLSLRQNDIRVSVIRFNDRYIDSLRGFAFKVYELKNVIAPKKIFGVAVFLSNNTSLDGYLQNSSELIIDYDPHPERSQIMDECKILAGTDFVTVRNSSIKVYDFSCNLIYGATP